MLWVLSWHYHDRSAYGVARIYKSKETADADYALMCQHAYGKVWILEEVPYIGY